MRLVDQPVSCSHQTIYNHYAAAGFQSTRIKLHTCNHARFLTALSRNYLQGMPATSLTTPDWKKYSRAGEACASVRIVKPVDFNS